MTDSEERIRDAFEDVPRIDDPDPVEHYAAETSFPDEVVPEDGPVPDSHHCHSVDVVVEVPDWVVYSLSAQLEHSNDADEGTARDLLLELVQLDVEHRTTDGESAVDVALDRARNASNGGASGR